MSMINLRPIPKPRKKICVIVDLENESKPGPSFIDQEKKENLIKPKIPPKPSGLSGVKFRKNLKNEKKTSESETDEERKAAAAKIVHHLQDGVEALTDVLDNFKSPEIENRVKMRPTAPPLESPDSETELTKRCPTFVVTESQIASTSDDVAKPCTCSPLPFMDSSMISTMDYIDNDENIWQPRKMEEKTDEHRSLKAEFEK
uniref:Uncharacterized protein n=1 Tax=Panagrolaimus sp. JU765 TaxID=591449 RepID=A0AC34PZX5_9BILA